MIRIILLLMLLPLTAFSSDPKLTSAFEYTEKINKRLDELKILQPDKYLNNFNVIRSNLEDYFDYKKKVCNGEYSSIILNSDKNITDTVRAKSFSKLSLDEKKFCFRELKALQITYINNSFVVRERYLKSIHKKTIAELSEAREKAINDLHRIFDRKSRGRKRR